MDKGRCYFYSPLRYVHNLRNEWLSLKVADIREDIEGTFQLACINLQAYHLPERSGQSITDWLVVFL